MRLGEHTWRFGVRASARGLRQAERREHCPVAAVPSRGALPVVAVTARRVRGGRDGMGCGAPIATRINETRKTSKCAEPIWRADENVSRTGLCAEGSNTTRGGDGGVGGFAHMHMVRRCAAGVADVVPRAAVLVSRSDLAHRRTRVRVTRGVLCALAHNTQARARVVALVGTLPATSA